MIAHRLNSIKNADNIIVMENGKIAEQGKHAELLAKMAYMHIYGYNRKRYANSQMQ
ncbi:hypothetical protein WBU86_20045 [Escherichia coli]